jgi:hypothetical protein
VWRGKDFGQVLVVILESVLVFDGGLSLATNADGKLFCHEAIYQISGGEQNESLS